MGRSCVKNFVDSCVLGNVAFSLCCIKTEGKESWQCYQVWQLPNFTIWIEIQKEKMRYPTARFRDLPDSIVFLMRKQGRGEVAVVGFRPIPHERLLRGLQPYLGPCCTPPAGPSTLMCFGSHGCLKRFFPGS